MADTLLKSSQGDVWIQKTPGQASEWLGTCVDLGDIAEPAGDQTLIQCRNRNGGYETIGSTQAPPGAVTVNIKRFEFKERSILDELRSCPFNVYVLQRACGQAGVITQWVRGKIIKNGRITTRTYAGQAAREDAESTIALDVSGDNPLLKPLEVTVRRQSIAETTDLNDIAFCNSEVCEGPCGAAKEPGTDGFLVGDAPGGSPASKADVWDTDDGGDNWVNSSGPHPFGAAEDVLSETCFPIDATTTRWIVAREASGVDHAEIAYSDDGGATWTQVEVGSVDGEGAAGEGALFSFDRDHIWFCTTAGNVYFSDDAGITWTLQSAAATADGSTQLNCIKFAMGADYDNGWAVGENAVIIHTTDGGETWAAITGPTGPTDDLKSLEVFTRNRVIFGTNTDELWQTWDEGVHWTAKTFTGQGSTGTVAALDFANALEGFMLHNPAAGQGYVHRTIDGGHIWKRLDTPANAGLNAMAVIDENTAFVVGNAQGGTGFVAKIS